MSRPKLIAVLAIVALALTALFIVPAFSFAAPSHPAEKVVARPFTPTIYYAGFSGTITSGHDKGLPTVGGLTLVIRHSGDFYGKFVTLGKTYINVNGTITSTGAITINFLAGNTPYLTGQGQMNSSGLTTGTFQVFNNGHAVSSGVWSALQNAGPTSTLALAFSGRVSTGPDTKMAINGPVVLNATSLKAGVTVSGAINLSDGTVLVVHANIDHVGHIEINLGVSLPHSHVIATGNPFYDSHIQARGYAGTFVGFRAHDAGNWTSAFFVPVQQ